MNYSNGSHWTEVAHSLGGEFAGRAAAHDEEDTFVSANYAALKERRVFSAAIPEELGGGGASHREISDMLRITRPILRLHRAGALDASASDRRHGLEVPARPGRRALAQECRRKTARARQHGRRRLVGVQRFDDQNRRRLSGQRPQTLRQPVRGRRHAGHECAVHGRGAALSGADECAGSHGLERLARARHERHRFSYRQTGKRLRTRCRHRFAAAARRLSPGLECCA